MDNKEYNEISLNDLEQVAGGYVEYSPDYFQEKRFRYDESEAKAVTCPVCSSKALNYIGDLRFKCKECGTEFTFQPS